MTCTTHHNACDCREAHFATIALEREHWFSLANQRALDLAAERERVRGLEADLAATQARLNWLANETMLCDYGDNDHGNVAWHLHNYSGAKVSIIGDSIDKAIDARKALGEG